MSSLYMEHHRHFRQLASARKFTYISAGNCLKIILRSESTYKIHVYLSRIYLADRLTGPANHLLPSSVGVSTLS